LIRWLTAPWVSAFSGRLGEAQVRRSLEHTQGIERDLLRGSMS